MSSRPGLSVRRLAIFLVIGALNSAYGIALIALLHLRLGLNAYLSNVLVYLAGGVLSYLANRRFTFKTAASPRAELGRYAVCLAIALGASLAVLRLLLWLQVPFLCAQIVAVAVNAGLGYLLAEVVAFRGERLCSANIPPEGNRV